LDPRKRRAKAPPPCLTIYMETIETVVKRFQPVGATLLCEPIVAKEKTEGGIIIPEVCRNPLNQGKVIAVGDGLDEQEWLHKIVMWTQHAESKLRIDDLSLAIVSLDNLVLRERVSAQGKEA